MRRRADLSCLVLLLGLAAAGCSRAVPESPVGACRAGGDLPTAEATYVVDGDTIHLSNRDKVRLIGINTPEIGRDGQPSQPFAQAARTALEEMVAGARVQLQDGVDSRDRYGRRLAHLFTLEGASVEAELLRRGLAFHVAVAPNFAYLHCLQQAEQEARKARRGVWSDAAYRPRTVARLKHRDAGFMRVRGRVTRVSFKDNGWWLQLDGALALRIEHDSQPLFRREALAALQGSEVEARGWLIPMGDWWQMKLPHPAMLQPL